MQNLINLYKTPSDLYQKVLNRIENEKNIAIIKKRLIVSSVVFSIAITCFVFSILFFLTAASQSGFSQMFSLIFSDFNIIPTYFTNFILSLLESLPTFNIILSLLMVLFVSSVSRFLTKDIKNFVIYSHVKY